MKGKVNSETDLADTLEQLTDEVRVLRMAVDELREEVQWTNRNADDFPAGHLGHFRITSMPADPADPDWAKRLNAVGPEDLVAEEMPPPARATVVTATPEGPAAQGSLF